VKVILVTQKIEFDHVRKEYLDCIDRRVINLLRHLNYVPVPIPNFTSEELSSSDKIQSFLTTVKANGIFLSGGNDLGEFPDRDATELFLLNYAEKNELPVLGICRGMQILANYDGVGLIAVMGHANTDHKIGGKINGIVKSYHNYSVESCPPNYEIIACAEDGIIEAIKHKSKIWEGWMWHPERNFPVNSQDETRILNIFG